MTAAPEQSADFAVRRGRRLATWASSRGWTEPVAVAALVVVAFGVYGLLSSQVQAPRIFVDETRYVDAADSVAHGRGLQTRGQAYGWAPAYPVALAPILLMTRERPAAYHWIKLANALLFALAAIPIYLLARRLLPRAAALTIAALGLAIPSSVYVGLVMTESLAYLASSASIYVMVCALERPTVARQFATLVSIALAYLVRPQFAVLFPVYLFALGAVRYQSTRRPTARELWPTVLSIVLVVCGVAALALARGSSVLGRYGDLWRSYSPVSVARWSVYHVADLALYFGLVPLVLLPVMLLALRRRAAVGSLSGRAFLAVFVGMNLLELLVVGAFSSTPYSQDRLQDRYLFYVVPLWLVAGGVWLRDGAPRPRAGVAAGGLVLLAVTAALPVNRLLVEDSWRQLVAAGTPLWTHGADWAAARGVSGHRAVFVIALVSVAAAFLIPRSWAWMFVAIVAVTLISNSVLLWRSGIEASKANAVAERGGRLAWIDARVHGARTVTMLYVPTSGCPSLGTAYAMTEFFNDRIGPVPQFGAVDRNGLPSESVRLDKNGWVVGPRGKPLVAHWLVVPTGVRVEGDPVARGMEGSLTLWEVSGRVGLIAHSEGQVESEACRAA